MLEEQTRIILMADDDEGDRLLVRDAWESSGLDNDLRFVRDGQELMDYLLRQGVYCSPSRSPRPDLILLDLNMPRKNGHEVLREMKANPNLEQIPVVMFTSSTADEDVARTYSLGGNSYITKPLTYTDLMRVIEGLGRYWLRTVELP
jgi:CheY-like chemotaxis protein